MPQYETFSKSMQCAWVQRMQEGAGKQWMIILSFYLGKVGETFIFDCNYDILTDSDFEKHKHVKSNETMFRRFGDIMT